MLKPRVLLATAAVAGLSLLGAAPASAHVGPTESCGIGSPTVLTAWGCARAGTDGDTLQITMDDTRHDHASVYGQGRLSNGTWSPVLIQSSGTPASINIGGVYTAARMCLNGTGCVNIPLAY